MASYPARGMLHTCPHCKRSLALDAPASGEQFACAHCNRTFVYHDPKLPPPVAVRVGDDGARVRPDRAAAAGFPASDGPEVDVLVLRPSPARSRPLQFFGFAALGLVGVAAGVFGWGNSWHVLAWAACLAGGLTAAAIPAWMKVKSLTSQVRVTNKRLIDRDGFLERRTSEVLHKDVRNVRVDQTLRDRMWRVGSIAIFTSGEEEPEIAIRDIPNPDRVREIMDLYRPM
jgi:hypothetical protein